MKNISTILFTVTLLGLLLFSCKTKYVPIESVRTEYKDRYSRDSIYVHDSIIFKQNGDSIIIEKYKYEYKDKIVRDTTRFISIMQIPFPVEVTKEVNKITSFQSFQIWCGRLLLLLILGYIGIKWLKK